MYNVTYRIDQHTPSHTTEYWTKQFKEKMLVFFTYDIYERGRGGIYYIFYWLNKLMIVEISEVWMSRLKNKRQCLYLKDIR